MVPRRAGKTAALTIQMFTDKLLKPEEILDKIDAKQAVEELREPLTRTVDAMARDLAEQIRPGLWDSLPAAGRTLCWRVCTPRLPGSSTTCSQR